MVREKYPGQVNDVSLKLVVSYWLIDLLQQSASIVPVQPKRFPSCCQKFKVATPYLIWPRPLDNSTVTWFIFSFLIFFKFSMIKLLQKSSHKTKKLPEFLICIRDRGTSLLQLDGYLFWVAHKSVLFWSLNQSINQSIKVEDAAFVITHCWYRSFRFFDTASTFYGIQSAPNQRFLLFTVRNVASEVAERFSSGNPMPGEDSPPDAADTLGTWQTPRLPVFHRIRKLVWPLEAVGNKETIQMVL